MTMMRRVFNPLFRGLPLLSAALLLLAVPQESTAAPLGKPEQLTSPDQVPQGLEKSDWSSIRAAHSAWEHSFQPVKGGAWQAQNKAQQWSTQFDSRGFMAKPKAPIGSGAWNCAVTVSEKSRRRSEVSQR
jgi:hypothetical protein